MTGMPIGFIACRSSLDPCGNDVTIPLRPLIRVIAVDSAGGQLEARVSRIRPDGPRSDTVPVIRLVELGTPPNPQTSAMTIAVIVDGYRESIVELGEVCYNTSQPVIVRMRR